MFRCTGYHLVTLDHSLCAIWSEKGHPGHRCQDGESLEVRRLSKVAGTFPVEFWGQKEGGGLRQGVLAC